MSSSSTSHAALLASPPPSSPRDKDSPHDKDTSSINMFDIDDDDSSGDESDSTIRAGTEEVTMVYMPEVPEQHEHTNPLHFISMSGLTQKELNAKVLMPG